MLAIGVYECVDIYGESCIINKLVMAVNKRELYKWIKIAGILSFIPFILIAGISAGYFIGGLMVRKFNAAAIALPVSVIAGIFVSAIEVIRIVRLVIRIDRQGR